jgi:PEP-CTERM motif
MRVTIPTLTIIICSSLLFAGSAKGIGPGQLDDFEDGTTQFWGNGGGGAPPVVNVDSGGPGGVDDNFMQITSVGGGGAGRFLVAFNQTQWVGNYISAGVIAIEMDLRNQGAVNLSIRLAFKEFGGFGSPGYLSSDAALLAPGSGWQHFVFTINVGSMIPIGGPADFNTFFSTGNGEMRIINEVGTTNLNGDVAVAQLGVDNIHAVPEPGTFALAGFGLVFLAAAFRRKRG